jgi:hypothetical protein
MELGFVCVDHASLSAMKWPNRIAQGFGPTCDNFEGKLSICFLPRRGNRTQPGVLTPGHLHTKTRPERAEDVWGEDFVHRSGSPPQKQSTAPSGRAPFLNRYPGIKPQAESHCLFGAETESFKELLKVNAYGMKPWAIMCNYFAVIRQTPGLISSTISSSQHSTTNNGHQPQSANPEPRTANREL